MGTKAIMKHSKHLTIVIKIGTSSIVDEKTHEPILPILSLIVDTAIKLRRDGHRVVIVSSGAIGVGLQRMNFAKRPKHLPQTQALAAIGQCRLMSIWDSLFAHMHQPVAQILLTRNDIADRSQYLNAQNTLSEVLNYGVIPIVNENDTLAVSEIKFGDNDTLSAITAAMVHADYLFLMTDVEALYDKNPRTNADAQPIRTVEDISSLKVDVSSRGSDLGTGGMATKIIAARLATSAGTTTIITKSSKPGNVKDIIRFFHPPETSSTNANGTDSLSTSAVLEAPPLHTRFLPSPSPMRNRAFWILHGLVPQGTIYVDRGASKALHNKAGLLPVGIVDVQGDFAGQEAVRIVVVDRATYTFRFPSRDVTSAHSSDSDLTLTTNAAAAAANTVHGDHVQQSSGGSTAPTDRPATTGAAPAPPAARPSSPRINSPRIQVQNQNQNPNPLGWKEIGRALTNYSADQIQRIMGLRSSEISKVLGYADTEYVAFRENISLTPTTMTATTNGSSSPSSTPNTNIGSNLASTGGAPFDNTSRSHSRNQSWNTCSDTEGSRPQTPSAPTTTAGTDTSNKTFLPSPADSTLITTKNSNNDHDDRTTKQIEKEIRDDYLLHGQGSVTPMGD